MIEEIKERLNAANYYKKKLIAADEPYDAWMDFYIKHTEYLLQEIASLEVKEWISVEDRLPEEGIPVWAAAIGQFPMIAAIMDNTEAFEIVTGKPIFH